MPPSGGRVYALPMRTASARSALANDAPPPTPAVLVRSLDPEAFTEAAGQLRRPLVCDCGAVEGDPGAALVGVYARPLARAGCFSVEAVCTRCAPDPRAIVGLGPMPPRSARRA